MKTMTLKGLFLCLVFLLCNATSHAADDLITRQVTIKLDKAGTLPDKIGSSKKYKITNLKIVGEINGTDWRLICDMASEDDYGRTKGKLSTLDLSDAKIVGGGNSYINIDGNSYYTSNDKLGNYAFYDCRVLTNLTIPSSVTSIGESAFRYCSGLTSLTIPSSVTSIGSDAFSGCSSLTNLYYIIDDEFETYLSKGHPYIDVNCGIEYYLNDKKITSVVIPSTITALGEYAFQKCRDLTSVYVSWPTPISAGSAFSGVGISKCTLYVPQGTEQDYFLADGWGDFGNIVEYDPTGIDMVTTSTDTKELSRYSVNGQRLSAPTKGLNIVKYSDGSVKKVAVQ